MLLEGTVRNGVIVLDTGTPLADGTRVAVEPIALGRSNTNCLPCDTRHSKVVFRMMSQPIFPSSTNITDSGLLNDDRFHGHFRLDRLDASARFVPSARIRMVIAIRGKLCNHRERTDGIRRCSLRLSVARNRRSLPAEDETNRQ